MLLYKINLNRPPDVSVWPHQILEAYQTQPQMKEMMKNVDFYVTPVLNIDGYTYTWENSTVSAHI